MSRATPIQRYYYHELLGTEGADAISYYREIEQLSEVNFLFLFSCNVRVTKSSI
jgi:hypothetical protein